MFPGSYASVDQEYLLQQFYQIGNYFDERPYPKEDWIGFHQDVDMGDIKVKYLDELGKDLHDYGEWESTLKKNMRQPFLEGSTDFLHEHGGLGRAEISSHIQRSIGSRATVHRNSSLQNSTHVEYNDDRSNLIQSKIREVMNAYI